MLLLSDRGCIYAPLHTDIMQSTKVQFIDFLLESKALLFKDFTLKSGRVSPYFFNLGLLNRGDQVSEIGRFFAETINAEFGDDFDIVFGPAYKGIPLAVSTVIALYENFKIDKRYCSNRKELKDYADKSILLGSPLKDGDKIIMVDDVLTTGQTKIDAVAVLETVADVEIQGLLIGLDRLETDSEGKNAVSEFTKKTGIPVKSIITAADIFSHISDAPTRMEMERYLYEYGVEKL